MFTANLFVILLKQRNFLFQIVTNASLWVESFLLLSGFLVAYGILREYSNKSLKNFNPLSRIIHRYFRLTPSLIGVIAFSIVQEVMTSGPIWNQYVQNSQSSCHVNWWTNLLYVNNIVGLNQLGKPQTEVMYCRNYVIFIPYPSFNVSINIIIFCSNIFCSHISIYICS